MSLAVPEPLHNILTSTNTSKQLYESLSAEHKAKIAVINAVVNCPREFHGRYRINGIIGYGGNGVVLSATQVTNNITVAVKAIYKSVPGTDQPYPSEIAVLQELNNLSTSNTFLKFITCWQDAHHFYLVTNLCGNNWLASFRSRIHNPLIFQTKLDGEEISHSISVSPGSCDAWAWATMHRKYSAKLEGHKRLPVEAVKCIVLQAAKALRELHSHGYYHGDVKLENLIIGMEDTRGLYVVLADFGHAKKVSSGICKYGTENAVPPEFLVGSPHLGNALDGREADVFALGMVLYILLSESGNLQDFHGRIDWKSINLNEGKFPFQFGEEFSTDSRDLLQQMCMVNPKGRISIQGVVDHQWF
ncbi:hypothetical protein HDU79_009435 [Rhizoclosmatium sp. JEL0117]|nr:hypothetical protein HDU79_009435 [Rhizoclosmatium sp. JEL0117]